MKKKSDVILSGMKTPPMPVKFSNILHPFYYSSAPQVPRYSITVVVDPELNKKFISEIQAIEKREKVDTCFKEELVKDKQTGEMSKTGKFIMKFQTKHRIDTAAWVDKKIEPVTVGDEFKTGTIVIIGYEIVRYHMQDKTGLSFQPKIVYFKKEEAPEKIPEPSDDISFETNEVPF